MTALADPLEVQVPFDGRFFLEVPAAVRDLDDAELVRWAGERVAVLPVQTELAANPEAAARHLAGQVGLLSEVAASAFLFCPRGLPADALVEVFVGESGVASLDDIAPPSAVALPVRTREVRSPAFGDGRVVASTVALLDGSLVGDVRYQWLHMGLLVELSVTARDLSILGAGLPLFEELAAGIRVGARAGDRS